MRRTIIPGGMQYTADGEASARTIATAYAQQLRLARFMPLCCSVTTEAVADFVWRYRCKLGRRLAPVTIVCGDAGSEGPVDVCKSDRRSINMYNA